MKKLKILSVDDGGVCSILTSLLLIRRGSLLAVIIFLFTLHANAFIGNDVIQQERLLKGVVKDEAGQPMPGVSVIIKGTEKGTQTDFDGKYSITVKESDVLVFSSIGYASQEIALTKKILDAATLDVVLQEASEKMGEIVLVGYTKQKKATSTSAVVEVKAEQMGQAIYTEISNGLQGLAPGVWLQQNSSLPGAQSTIRIRGSSSDPLFVIDGFVTTRDEFDALAPDEVDKITVLKDLAATAQYGARASNGVILVTTKSGEDGKISFQYRSSVGTGDRKDSGMGDWTARDEMIYRNNATKNDDARHNVDRAEGTAARNNPMPFTDAEINSDRPTYDMMDYVWKGNMSFNHSISARGSSDNKKIKYYVLGGLRKDDGPFINTKASRLNLRVKLNVELAKGLTMKINSSYNEWNRSRYFWNYADGIGNVTVENVYATINGMPHLYPYYLTKDGNALPPGETSDYPVMYLDGRHAAELLNDGGYRRSKIGQIRNRGALKYEIPFVKGLNTTFSYAYGKINSRAKSMNKFNKFYSLEIRTGKKFEYLPPTTRKQNDNSGDGTESLTNNYSEAYWHLLNYRIDYNRKFLDKHDVGASVIYETSRNESNSIGTRQRRLLSTDVDQIFATSRDASDRTSGGGESDNGRISQVGVVSYSFDDKYSLQYTIRRDGSMKFAPDKRYGIFSSYSAAWNVHKESFMQGLSYLKELKIRASYGEVGNDSGISNFAYQDTYSNGGSFVFANTLASGIRADTPPNKNIRWATTVAWNVGLDFSFLDEKIYGTFDIFSAKDQGLLGARRANVPSTYGASFANENYRENQRDGFEILLGTKGKIAGVEYTISGNMGYAKDKVLVLDENEDYQLPGLQYRSQIGKRSGRHWGYRAKGIVKTQAQADALNQKGHRQFGKRMVPGMLLFEDIRGPIDSQTKQPSRRDGIVDGNDRDVISNDAFPTINFGFNLNFKYKGAYLNARFSGVGPYDKMVRGGGSGGGAFQIGAWPYLSIWKDAYDEKWNPNGIYPGANSWGDASWGNGGSTFWIRNGGFVRLKQLDIGYEVPRKYIEKIMLKGLTISGSATNLFTIHGMNELEGDPEQNDLRGFPIFRNYNVNIVVNF